MKTKSLFSLFLLPSAALTLALALLLTVFSGAVNAQGQGQAAKAKAPAMAEDEAMPPDEIRMPSDNEAMPLDDDLPLQKVDINRAGVKTLVRLKGVGPKLAERIVRYRKSNGSFTRIEQLRKVKGIDTRVLRDNRHLLTL